MIFAVKMVTDFGTRSWNVPGVMILRSFYLALLLVCNQILFSINGCHICGWKCVIQIQVFTAFHLYLSSFPLTYCIARLPFDTDTGKLSRKVCSHMLVNFSQQTFFLQWWEECPFKKNKQKMPCNIKNWKKSVLNYEMFPTIIPESDICLISLIRSSAVVL